SRRVKVDRVRRSRFAGLYGYETHRARLARKVKRHEAMGYVLAVVDVAPGDGLSLAPFLVRLLVADPDSRRPHARRFAVAHKVEGVAVGRDPRLLVGAIAVDGVGQALRRRPILRSPGPLAAL